MCFSYHLYLPRTSVSSGRESVLKPYFLIWTQICTDISQTETLQKAVLILQFIMCSARLQ
jgi:hypothetical protein